MNHLALFTGINGFGIAANWAGFETVGFSEIDLYCCKLLAEKYPEIPNYGDIRTADFSELRGRIDVLSAGVPCQPSSLAGKRRGEKDDRWLWPATLAVVGCVKPAWAIFENPPGILSLDEFGGVLLRLESLGYEVRAFSVPANAVGAKHRRQRVFIVCNSSSARLPRGGCKESRKVRDQAWGSELSGRSEALADANSTEWRPAQLGRNEYHGQETGWRQGADRFEGICNPDDSNANSDDEYRRSSDVQVGRSRSEKGIAANLFAQGNQWFTQSPLCRRADGIRDRSHRLRALGNAVVPQQAYPFFAAIAQTELNSEPQEGFFG
jgi:DNA (cytosine-5)-methyltransferase 1